MAVSTRQRRPTVTLGVRPWAHLMPLLSRAVRPNDFDLVLTAAHHTPDLLAHPDLDGAETSFSRYVLAQDQEGEQRRFVGLPAFVMRAFRHRCFLVRRDSELIALDQLRGCRIGLTGWPDSGNTWTRALLRRAGVGVDTIKWKVGPVSAGDQPKQRPGTVLPANVDVAEPGESLLDALAEGSLDVVLTPFTPTQLQADDESFRHLLPDFKHAEAEYYRDVGFVPGIHVVALKREIVEKYPWLPAALMETLEESKRAWQNDRRHYAETTPWMLEDILRTERLFGSDWMPYGDVENASMVSQFCEELHEQGISRRRIDPSTVFGDFAKLSIEYGRQYA